MCLSAELGDKHQKGTYYRSNGVSSQLKKDVCSLESLNLIFSGKMVFLDVIKGRIKKINQGKSLKAVVTLLGDLKIYSKK